MKPRRTSSPGRIPGRARSGSAVLALGLGLTFVLAGCSGGSGSDAERSAAPSAARDFADGNAAGRTPADSLVGKGTAAPSTVEAAQTAPQVPAVIWKGTVVLQATDVAGARFDVVTLVDRFDGQVSAEQTDTDAHGRVTTAHLVLRIPSAHFKEALDALERVGDLKFSGSTSKDVTTQLIDTRVRARAQRRSIRRIEQLLARAQNLRDIVLIEGELTRRQSDLESLEHQLAYLEDQTSMSTITVDVDRTPRAAATRPDHTGFLAGLAAGWHGLTAVALALATASGALLPWLAVLLVLAIPGWPLVRRLRRAPDAARPEEPAQA